MPVKGLKFAIPDDLDVSELACFQVQWPDTPQWRSILAGLLYMVSRGRPWDERSGSVVAAQAAGTALFNLNVPLVSCNGLKDHSRGSGGYSVAWCYDESEECDEMGCYVEDVCWVQVGGGLKLAIKRCGKWELAVKRTFSELVDLWCDPSAEYPNFEDLIDPDIPGPGPIPDPDDLTGRHPACDKAYAIAEATWAVAAEMFDNRDIAPGFYNSAVQRAFPEYSFRFTYLTLSQAVFLASGFGSFEDNFSADDLQSLKCKLEEILTDDTYVLTQSEWNKMGVQVFVAMGADQAAACNAVWAAMGRDDFETICKGSQLIEAADCTCPEPDEEYPGYIGKVMTWDFDYFSPNTTENHDVELGGDTPLPDTNWIAAIWQWNGENAVNGVARATDAQGSNTIIGTYTAPFTGTFGRYTTAQGHAFLDAHFPAITHESNNDGTSFQDGIMTIQTTGNNVDVHTDGTLYLFYPEE